MLGPGNVGCQSRGHQLQECACAAMPVLGGGLGGAGSRGAQRHGPWKAPTAVVHIDEVFKSFSHSDIYGVVFYCALNLHFPCD